MIHLPFNIILSITAMSSLNVHYGFISCSTRFQLSGQPLIIIAVVGDLLLLLPVVFLVKPCSLGCQLLLHCSNVYFHIQYFVILVFFMVLS